MAAMTLNPASKSSLEPRESSGMPSLQILGIGFHPLTLQGAVSLIETWIQARRPRHICLANAQSVSLCWEYPEYRRTLDHADLVLPDGMSIVWGGRWIGVQLPERVAGPDLTEALCAAGERKGYRIYLLGSTPENLERLRQSLLLRHPRLQIVGTHSPSMSSCLSPQENENIRQRIQAVQPDILLVGMSAPKQELWIASNLHTLNVPICMGIGAAFDFLSGRIPRAPLFLQKCGLEWLYRLYREPRRLWKRYLLGNAIFLSHLGVAWIRRRFSHPSTRSSVDEGLL
jgi:N-acetylglucosaminyldiphosphoundecaprenol N-acetyl-beta-D-mannosaminyltransferase